MGTYFTLTDFQASGLLLLLGFIFFLTGAMFWKPKEYQQALILSLPAIHRDRKKMRWIFSWMIVGLMTTGCGWITLAPQLWDSNDHLAAPSGALFYLTGAALMILSICFRLTVQEEAAKETAENRVVPVNYPTFNNWADSLYSFHMISSYISWALLGASILWTGISPVWLGWTGVAGGVICALGFIFSRGLLFAPPILVHLYTAITGIVILWG